MADLPITSDQGAQPIVINDPTTTANVANVKAASTASVATDSSLVVALSPNSPVPTGTNKIGVTGVAQGSTTSGQNGDLVQGAVTTSAPTYVTGTSNPLSLNTAGSLRIDVTSWLESTVPTVGQKTSANSVPVVIASDQGSTSPDINNIAYFVQNNKVYAFSADINAASAGTNNPIILIRNPNGSGKTMWLYKYVFGCNITNVSMESNVYANPTVTANGTAQTPASVNVGGGAPASSILINTLPTVTATGTQLTNYVAGQNTTTVGFFNDIPIALNANNALLITADPASNNRAVSVTLMWVEI